jgi:hypothetical protein
MFQDPNTRTLEFVFKVLDPFIFENWGLYAIDFNEEFGDHYEHILDSLVSRDIFVRIFHQKRQKYGKNPHYAPGPKAPAGYAKWFKSALEQALAGGG